MKRTLFFVLTLLALFSLLPAQNSPLTLTAPNGGEVWTTGSTYDITWIQANLAGNLSIMLIGANGPGSHTILIAQAVPVTDQTYSWTIPATVPPGTNYRVRISLINPNGMMLYDLSDAPFTIQGGTTPPPQPAITVVSPNGGETWDAGSTYDITWTYQNLEGDVRISLVGPTASQQQLITEATPIASGQYSWTIPATVAPGLYKIHIVWVTLLTVYFGDLSDAPFLIQGGTPPPPPPVPSLTLTAPNGGEIWDSGSSYDITWTFENVTGNVTLMLLGPATNPANNLIAQDIPVSVGTYAWTIPATVLPGDHYKVRISVGANAGFYITDVSDGYFTITGDVPPPPPVPVLTLTAPNGGEQWTSGSTYDITWTYENVTGNVTLMLLGPATHPNNNLIAQNVPVTDETFAWTIPATVLPGSYYHVRIFSQMNPNCYVSDVSDTPFTITGGTPPPPLSLTLTAPNGGEIWQAGTTQAITWTFDGTAGQVMLQLMGGPQITPVQMIAHNVPATAGTFNWHIPPYQMPLDAYKVRISLLANSGVVVADESDATFTITPAVIDTVQIVVTAPNGGEQWATGSTQDITWTASDYSGNVGIFLVRCFDRHPHNRFPIAMNAPNTGSFSWTIPLNLPAGDNYKVMIRRINGFGADISDAAFSIANAPVEVKASPNPTPQGTTLTFEAKSASPASVRIYNIKGQVVRSLVEGQILTGNQSIVWDGNDNHGRKVSAGLYFARISGPEIRATKRIIVVK